MADAIAVLNAGSSSIKFSLFSLAAQGLTLSMRGQVDALHAAPTLKLCDPQGGVLGSSVTVPQQYLVAPEQSLLPRHRMATEPSGQSVAHVNEGPPSPGAAQQTWPAQKKPPKTAP